MFPVSKPNRPIWIVMCSMNGMRISLHICHAQVLKKRSKLDVRKYGLLA